MGWQVSLKIRKITSRGHSKHFSRKTVAQRLHSFNKSPTKTESLFLPPDLKFNNGEKSDEDIISPLTMMLNLIMMGKRNRHRLPSFGSLKSPLVLRSVNREIQRFSSCRTMCTCRLFAKYEYYVAIIKSVQQAYDCAVKEDVLDRLLYYISTQRTNSDKKPAAQRKTITDSKRNSNCLLGEGWLIIIEAFQPGNQSPYYHWSGWEPFNQIVMHSSFIKISYNVLIFGILRPHW